MTTRTRDSISDEEHNATLAILNPPKRTKATPAFKKELSEPSGPKVNWTEKVDKQTNELWSSFKALIKGTNAKYSETLGSYTTYMVAVSQERSVGIVEMVFFEHSHFEMIKEKI
jgi:hypothetical protein